MTGRCVCKPGILGMKCDECPAGTILGPEGCLDESLSEWVSGSCDILTCFHGAECRELPDRRAQCKCDLKCDALATDDFVCGSDGNTYASECQMKLFSCRYQRTIEATALSACPKDSKKKHSKIPLFLKRSTKKKHIWMQRQLNNFTASTRSKRDKYNS
ncbi:hypothetical protein JTE90_023665, partial [Oedothorax gibbosus]